MPTATADVASPASKRTASTGTGVRRLGRSAATLVPSASTTAFRIAFGLLIVFSTIRFVARGWVEEFYLAPEHHLTYAGFDWVRPLPVPLMYLHLGLLITLGVAITVGYRTRVAAGLFAIGFAYVELIDSALYLNHYWFVTLVAITLAIVPSGSGGVVPVITVWTLRAQIAVVYVFAGVAKLNPDWLWRAQPMSIWLAARTDRPVIGALLDERIVAFAFSWAGAAFDLTIVGWLLWRRSRPIAYVVVVVFHVATAMLFQIGVFPWVMIALTPIFFGHDWPRAARRAVHRRLRPSSAIAPRTPSPVSSPTPPRAAPPRPALPRPAARTPGAPPTASRRIGRPTMAALAVFAAVNIVLPLRHYSAAGNVRFNDDGYYLSWRVMLTERAGFLEFDVRDPASGESWTVRPDLVLAEWQAAQATRRPDLALATAHLVAADYARRGVDDVEVFANSWVAFNGHPSQRWIDPDVDLAHLDRDASGAEYVLGERDG